MKRKHISIMFTKQYLIVRWLSVRHGYGLLGKRETSHNSFHVNGACGGWLYWLTTESQKLKALVDQRPTALSLNNEVILLFVGKQASKRYTVHGGTPCRRQPYPSFTTDT